MAVMQVAISSATASTTSPSGRAHIVDAETREVLGGRIAVHFRTEASTGRTVDRRETMVEIDGQWVVGASASTRCWVMADLGSTPTQEAPYRTHSNRSDHASAPSQGGRLLDVFSKVTTPDSTTPHAASPAGPQQSSAAT